MFQDSVKIQYLLLSSSFRRYSPNSNLILYILLHVVALDYMVPHALIVSPQQFVYSACQRYFNSISPCFAVCDPKSLLFLYGMQLDYSDALIGGGFSFKNPNATQTCGCGKSFTAEM